MKTSVSPTVTPDQVVAEAGVAVAGQREIAPGDWAPPSVNWGDDFGREISWSAGATGRSIAPGQSFSGFALVGEAFQPGFVTARFSPTTDPQPLSSQNVPSAVQDQLRHLDKLNFQFKTVLTLGPRYSTQDAKLSRVADFYSGASVLIQAGHLKRDSPFVSEMMSALRAYLDSAAQSPPMPIEDFTDSPIQIRNAPSNWLESQILEAMKISIGVNGA